MHLVYETGDCLVSFALEGEGDARRTVKKRQNGESSFVFWRRHLLNLHTLRDNVMMSDHDLTI